MPLVADDGRIFTAWIFGGVLLGIALDSAMVYGVLRVLRHVRGGHGAA